MKHHSLFLVLPLTLAFGCGIAVDERKPDDGQSGDGDGDKPNKLPGIRGGDGDDIYYGDGDLVGDGDYYGDGDGDRPPTISSPGGGGTPVDFATCQQAWGFSEETYCELEYQCENGWLYAYCDSNDGKTFCACDGPGSSLQLELNESIASGACEQTAVYCAQPDLLSGAEPVCEQTYAETGPDYCGAGMECTREVVLDENVTASSYEWRDAWCDGHQGDWGCECSGNGQNVRIELTGAQKTPEICMDVLELCSTDALTPTGTTECSPRYQWADRNWCDMELECGYPATFEGQAVEVFHYQYAGCENVGQDSWECWCGNAGTERFTVQSESGWDACGTLTDACGSD